MPNTQTLLAQAYSAFNHRDIDTALALMSENVSWPKASEGGRVVGKEEIRSYWTRQWKEFDLGRAACCAHSKVSAVIVWALSEQSGLLRHTPRRFDTSYGIILDRVHQRRYGVRFHLLSRIGQEQIEQASVVFNRGVEPEIFNIPGQDDRHSVVDRPHDLIGLSRDYSAC